MSDALPHFFYLVSFPNTHFIKVGTFPAVEWGSEPKQKVALQLNTTLFCDSLLVMFMFLVYFAVEYMSR